MMNLEHAQLFHDLYLKFESGSRLEALAQLRELAEKVEDPWDSAELLYHQALWLLELGRVSESRVCLEEFKGDLGVLTTSPADDYRIERAISLSVMASYAEIKILLAEGRGREALPVLQDLERRYANQLSTPDFREIHEELQIHHGVILANLGRWSEAKPFLESAVAPEAWRGLLSFYLGQMHYELGDHQRAKRNLVSALSEGLEGVWEARAHYVLGIVMYRLGYFKSALHEFEMCVRVSTPEYLGTTRVWAWLEASANSLGMAKEAELYRERKLSAEPPGRSN